MLKKLYDSHRQLEASAERLSNLIDAPQPDAEAVQAARWDIGKRILQHMALEDRHLFANLVRDKRPAVATLARKYQADFAGHVASYAEHAKRWTAERVVADWNGYRVMTREQLRLLRARINQVEKELFPLARGISLNAAHDPAISWTREAFAIKDSISGSDEPGGNAPDRRYGGTRSD
jgi:hypothetical protein